MKKMVIKWLIYQVTNSSNNEALQMQSFYKNEILTILAQ